MTGIDSSDPLIVRIAADDVIVVIGEIDLAGGSILEAAVAEHESERPVVLDLEAVAFVDSSGLRSLLGMRRRASERGTLVVLRNPSAEVLRLLEITGTGDQFSIESGSESDAE
ncbi:MAG: STAS domain-containing protein [Ilumatobacteraceae bacterium]